MRIELLYVKYLEKYLAHGNLSVCVLLLLSLLLMEVNYNEAAIAWIKSQVCPSSYLLPSRTIVKLDPSWVL